MLRGEPESLYRAVVISHKTCGMRGVERASMLPLPQLYGMLWNRLGGPVILATCNRVEVYWHGGDEEAVEDVRRMFDALADVGGCMAVLRGLEAARHLFRVAAGLDSMMIGETEILGQVSEALREALRHGEPNPYVEFLFNRAVHVGRRARRETGISKGAISIPLASVRVAERILGGLKDKRVLIIGAGTAASIIASEAASRKPTRILILNRTVKKARRLAEKLGAEWGGLSMLPQVLGEFNVVFVAVSGAPTLLPASLLQEAEARPLIVDISTPPAAEHVEGARIITLDSLRREAEENAARRRAEALKAEALVEEEVKLFLRLVRRMEADRVVSAITMKAEIIRRKEVERAFRALKARGLYTGDGASGIIEAMSRSIARKILQPVYEAARRAAEEGDYSRLSLILELFGGDRHELP